MTVDPRQTFIDLFGLERWSRLQAHFSQVLGLPLRTLTPERTLLVEPSWPEGLDVQQVTDLFQLGQELDDLLPKDSILNQPAVTSRPLGVSFAAIPMRVARNQVMAYLVVGPFLLGQRERAESFKARMEGMGLDPDPIGNSLLTLKLYSYSAFRSVLSFLEEVSNTLLEFVYQAQKLHTLVPEARHVDQVVAKHYSKRLCHSLLEVATIITQAEGGSVMLYEPSTETYRIAAAQGLPEPVTTSTQLSLGQGIAGLAAQRRVALLLDDQIQDVELKARMERPKLSSSLVAPLISESDGQPPLGVLNLRTSRPHAHFTQDHAELINKLLQLAETAFTSIALSNKPLA